MHPSTLGETTGGEVAFARKRQAEHRAAGAISGELCYRLGVALRRGAIVAVSLALGCSAGLRPVQQGTLIPRTQSIVVVGVEDSQLVQQVLLQRMQGYSTALSLEESLSEDQVQVFGAPPGTYCLASVKAGGVYYDLNLDEQEDCPSVKYGMSVYLGHLVFRLSKDDEPYFRWERRVDETCKALKRHDPEVLIRLAGSDPDFIDCLEDTNGEDFELSAR